MTYQVRISGKASIEAEDTFNWVSQWSPLAAARWQENLVDTLRSLQTLPARCSLAPESEFTDREVRQLFFGKRRHRYRVVFEIMENTVHVLHIRHGGRALMEEL